MSDPLMRALAGSERILVAGAGGGFDFLAGLPLVLGLRARGHEVHYANLTFSYMGASDAQLLAPGLYRVDAATTGDERYFPEKYLAEWFRARGEPDAVFVLDKMGLAPLREAYATLTQRLDVDAVVLFDGGTDILMQGDEPGLGTPVEDITSLLAVHALPLPGYVACVGFGIDDFHGVSHHSFLENVAELTRAGASLGVHALVADDPHVAAWLSALDHVHARMPGRESIVNQSLADAVRGHFGDHHTLARTRESGSELFINPLMSLVWSFELGAVAERVKYREELAATQSVFEVMAIIEDFRRRVTTRPRKPIPL